MMKINMKQIRSIDQRFIDVDNIRIYNNIMQNSGNLLSLDYSAYVEFCNEFGVFYTLTELTGESK